MRIFIGSNENYTMVNLNPGTNDRHLLINRNIIKNLEMHNGLQMLNPDNQEFEIVILENITTIGNGAFKDRNNNHVCTALRSVTIRGVGTVIEQEAFKGCAHLKNVLGLNHVRKIGDYAFENCTEMVYPEDHLPADLVSIGTGIFKGCTINHAITWRPNNGNSVVLVYSPKQLLINNIPNDVNVIGDGVFEEYTELQSIQIPDSVTKIGWFAFAGCTSLESVHLNAVTEIGGGAFYNCSNLQSAKIQNVRKIGWYAFAGCQKLTGVNIPVHATQDGGFIRSGAFSRNNLTDRGQNLFEQATPRIDMWHPDEQGFENSILNEMIKGIIRYNEEKGWLNQYYKWNARDNEIDTTIKFNVFSRGNNDIPGLIGAVHNATVEGSESIADLERDANKDNPEKEKIHILKECVRNVLNWGGSYSPKELNDFTIALINIRNDIYYEKGTLLGTIEHLLEYGADRIAFWSKILAAYKPGGYFIYDSRVAFSLSYISLFLDLPVIWNIPIPKISLRNRNAYRRFGLIKEIFGIIQANRKRYGLPPEGYNVQTSYRLYLDFINRLAETMIRTRGFNPFADVPLAPSGNDIKRQYLLAFNNDERKAVMAHLEKMLFMMKMDILKVFDPTIVFDDED